MRESADFTDVDLIQRGHLAKASEWNGLSRWIE